MFGMKAGAGAARILRRLLCLVLVLALWAGSACADIFIDQEKPEGWEDQYLLRIYALYSLDCDAYVLECDGETMILDGGKNASYLTEFLEQQGISHVEMIVNSHPHDDHIDAVYNAIKNGKLTADVFYSPFRENYSDASDTFQKRTVRLLAQKGIVYRQLFSGDEFQLGGARIKVYHFDGQTKKPNGGSMMINDMSGVFRICFGSASILFTADIGGTIQQMLAQEYGKKELKSDIMTAPHHGKNAMNGDLLQTVSPKLAIITGKVSRVKDCQTQLEQNEIAWKVTSWGNITLETDGRDWYVNQEDKFGELKNGRSSRKGSRNRSRRKRSEDPFTSFFSSGVCKGSRPAAVEPDDFPVEVFRHVQQPHRRFSHLLRRGNIPCGNLGNDFRGFFFRKVRVHTGVHDPGRQGVYLDMRRRQLPGQRPGKGVHRALRSAVGHLAGSAANPPYRGDVQDFAALRADHVRHKGVASVVKRGEVGPHHRVPFLRAHVRQQSGPGDGGVVDQHVHRAEIPAQGFHEGKIPRVAGNGDTKKIPRRGNKAGGLFQRGGVRAAGQYNFAVLSGTGACQRQRPADAPGGAGDQKGAHISIRTR